MLNISKSIINCIDSILKYETPNLKPDINVFPKYARQYDLNNEQTKKILEIIDLNEKHKKSSMEFVRENKIVILSDNLKTQSLDLQIIKTYLLLAKELLMKVNQKIKSQI